MKAISYKKAVVGSEWEFIALETVAAILISMLVMVAGTALRF